MQRKFIFEEMYVVTCLNFNSELLKIYWVSVVREVKNIFLRDNSPSVDLHTAFLFLECPRAY